MTKMPAALDNTSDIIQLVPSNPSHNIIQPSPF